MKLPCDVTTPGRTGILGTNESWHLGVCGRQRGQSSSSRRHVQALQQRQHVTRTQSGIEVHALNSTSFHTMLGPVVSGE